MEDRITAAMSIIFLFLLGIALLLIRMLAPNNIPTRRYGVKQASNHHGPYMKA